MGSLPTVSGLFTVMSNLHRFILCCALALCGCSSPAAVRPSEPPAEQTPADDRSLVNQQTKVLVTQLEEAGALINDPSFSRIADAVIKNLGIEREGVKARVLLVRNPAINSLALYDGTLCVYSGLIAKLTHPSQLAFVLAHEATHWQREHTLLQFQSSTNTLLAAQLADTLITPIAARFQLKAVAERGIDFASIAATSMYSRELEDEADKLGASALVHAGYDPQGALDVIRIFEGSAPAYTTAGAEILRTHSDNSSRSALLQQHLGLTAHPEEATPLLYDPVFILRTASIRITNASWTARSGAFFDALESLDIVLSAYKGKKRDESWYKAQYQRGEIYQAMARDLHFAKLSLSSQAWREVYGESSDEAVAESWCSQAREAFTHASNDAALKGDVNKQLQIGRCSSEIGAGLR